jgi:protein TonB
MLEFAPEMTAPAESDRSLAVGSLQTEPASEDKAGEQQQSKPKTDKPVIEPRAAETADLAADTQRKERPETQEASLARPTPSAPPPPEAVAPKSAAPAPGEQSGPTKKRLAAWQISLVAHLERFKRYPKELRAYQGVVHIAFTIDRAGKLVNSSVARSSGSPLLDTEALSLVQRAQPFPQPPAGTSDGELTQVAPIGFAPASGRKK